MHASILSKTSKCHRNIAALITLAMLTNSKPLLGQQGAGTLTGTVNAR